MGYRQIPGTFQAFDDSGLTIADGVSQSPPTTAFNSQRSGGATILAVASLAPQVGQRWRVLSVGFTGYLGLKARYASGKFGKVIAGLDISPTNPYPSAPGSFSYQPLPNDPSLTATMWDPSVNDLPPLLSLSPSLPQVASLLPVFSVIQIPSPPIVELGSAMQVGIWMTPLLMTPTVSLGLSQGVNIMFLQLYFCSYVFGVDDGL